jgi:hypothetical protein
MKLMQHTACCYCHGDNIFSSINYQNYLAMKILVSVLLLVLFINPLYSQLKKGQWLIGGTASFSHTNTFGNNPDLDNESKSTTISVAPGAGYFFADRFCGGLRFEYEDQRMRQEVHSVNPFSSVYYLSTSKISATGVSPFVRYYVLPGVKKINVFADASYIHSWGKNKDDSYSETLIGSTGLPTVSSSTSHSKYKSDAYAIAAGPVLFISSKVSFELSLGVTFLKINGSPQKATNFTAGTGFQVHL